MFGFADETFIDVSSGNGGSGSVSFRREKYIPRGGPDGGDGGKGGDIIFVVKNNLKTLSHLKLKRVYRAENGRPGSGRRKHGRNGKNIEIPVPPGTIIKDSKTGEILKDLTGIDSWVLFKGGKGGLGNWHFSTSRKQTPRYAQEGMPGEECRVHIELHLIADIGFVGYPNAGKSSLLKALTNATPRVASYAFTTKIPNLGVLKGTYRDVVLADIPGIIEGASDGAGLGIKFLKHISRTKAIAFIIDCDSSGTPETFSTLMDELTRFSVELARKKRIVIGTKMDLAETENELKNLRQSLPKEHIIGVSSFTRDGLSELIPLFESLAE